MPTAEKVEENLSQWRMETSSDCGSLGMWRNLRKSKKALAARGAEPSTGQKKINAINCVKFVKDHVSGSVEFMKTDVMCSVKCVRIVMTGSSRFRSERRANVQRRQMRRRT